ncbi:MAG: cell division protein ZapD [Proteobacteria bacterium]|nr:cell division protein ZapD [Pseudomonadota bacterium]
MQDIIIYEQPLNERMRTFLRLEHLFKQTAYTLGGFAVWDSRASLSGLISILDILSRGDLKNEILKELERLQSSLSTLRNIPEVDSAQLTQVLTQLENSEQDIHNLDGQFGQALREHELIVSLRQRSSIVGGDCDFDLPAYHFWLEQEPEKRITDLEQWFASLACLKKPVLLILAILRESSDAVQLQAEAGYYQQNLDAGSPVQLLRVGLARNATVFPEISAGKHRFTVRFLAPQDGTRPSQTEETISFQLYICAL